MHVIKPNVLKKGRHITTAYVRQVIITGVRKKVSTAHSSITTTLMD
jgi:hypothetical protein